MHSLFRLFHLGDPPIDRSLADDAESAPLLGGRRMSSTPTDVPAGGRRFTQDHEEALQGLHDIVQALASPDDERRRVRFRATPGQLLGPKLLSLLGDLHEIRHDAPRLLTRLERNESSRALGRDVVLLFARILTRGVLSSEAVLKALTEPCRGRAPFLLRLASAAVHDVPLSMAMCELLIELSRAVGPPRLVATLLTLDSPEGARTGDALPQGMKDKYTSFLGRLIGDGDGEWGNDGAVHAIIRLYDEGLLPGRDQVVRWRSSVRWGKQDRFVRLCNELRARPPWQPPVIAEWSLEAMAGRLAVLRGELSGRTGGGHLARRGERSAVDRGSICDEVVRARVEEVLSEGWRQARDHHESLITDKVSMPAIGLPDSGEGGPLKTLCLPGLTRLPKSAPVRLVERVTAQVLRDEALRLPLARAATSGVSDAFSDLVARTVRPHVERALDMSDRLAEFLPEWDVAVYRVRLTADDAAD